MKQHSNGSLQLIDTLNHDGITVTICTARVELTSDEDREKAHARHQKAIQSVRRALNGLDTE